MAVVYHRKLRSSPFILTLTQEDAENLVGQIRQGVSDEFLPNSVPEVINLLAIARSSLKVPGNSATLIGANLSPLLEQCFTVNNVEVQRSAIWTSCILTRGDAELKRQYTKYLPLLIQFLQTDSPDYSFQSDCLRFLANVIADSIEGRDAFLGTIPLPDSLLNLVTKLVQPKLLQEIASLICIITERCSQAFPALAFRETVFEILNRILAFTKICSCRVIRDVCRTLLNLLKFQTSDVIEMVKGSNIVKQLVVHTTGSSPDMKCERICLCFIIQLIVILFHGDNNTCQVFIDQGALIVLTTVIEEDRRELFYYMCVAIANVFACDSAQIQCAMNYNLLTEVIRQLEHGDLQIQHEAGYALGSFLDGACKEQVLYAFEQGLIPPLVVQLESSHAETVFDTLVSLFKLMYHAASLNKTDEFLQEMIEFNIEVHIARLSNDENEIISRLAKHFRSSFLCSDGALQQVNHIQ